MVRYWLLLVAATAGAAWAQQNPVRFELTADPLEAAPGKTARLRLSAKIEPGWHLYSLTSPVRPTATKVSVPEGSSITLRRVLQPKVEAKFDPAAAAATESYEDEATFLVDVDVKEGIAAGPASVNLEVRSSACNDKICLPPRRRTVTGSLVISGGAAPVSDAIPDGYMPTDKVTEVGVADPSQVATKDSVTPKDSPTEDWGPFLAGAFGWGLAAILTPCVFPMIPFTLSYFVNQGGGQANAVRQAVVFCVGIVVFFTGIGLLASLLVGASGAQSLAANVWVNGGIGLLFFAFGLSMLGAFEIALPSGLLTRLNAASEGGGYAGSLLMGLTFSLTAFACIGPFMGTLLAASVGAGAARPAAGMATFAAGLASPFFLLALFPAWLKKLPRSGNWMIRVKAVLGFFVLAMAVKYFSNVDAVLHWDFLTRERFLALWVVLTALPAFYLLGWLRFDGINADEPVTIPRLLIGGGILALSLSLLAGLFGAPMGEIDAYVPASTRAASVAGAPGGVHFAKNDLPGALARAKSGGQQVFLNFTGYTCTNCKLMKANMFPRPEIASVMNQFELVELYTDGLDAESEANQKLQEETHKTVAIPFYVILDSDGKVLRSFPGLTRDAEEFLRFLKG